MNKNIKKARKLADCIREELQNAGIGVFDIYLFGSRAKETAERQSDWDFLVITETEIDRALQRTLKSRIRLKLAFSHDVAADILLHSKADVTGLRQAAWKVSSSALAEGILV